MKEIEYILEDYYDNFKNKIFDEQKSENDVLMDIFGITEEIKVINKQYWGRQLGLMFEKIVIEVFKRFDDGFKEAMPVGSNRPYDLQSSNEFIDTKYRIGSGDSGTLKKFKSYGKEMRKEGKIPVILILREDNLPAAIKSLDVGGWEVYIGDKCFNYIYDKTGFKLKDYFKELKLSYDITKK
ncbi:restriction endonuclease [Staphylococcus xylosus]|uniref:restriction endonuclease n=2 Tax=Staphylococcus xylosus TaxID=1288 RepID=UPI001F1BEFF8|nr:restriction endonuclease [Staphylococcus xylosus]